MKSLREYLLTEKLSPDFSEDLYNFWNINNKELWLFETYDEIQNISEYDFYNNKYNSMYVDIPKYWFWQQELYETLSYSLHTTDKIFIKLLRSIKGVKNVKVDNEYIIEIHYDDEFNVKDDVFQSFLNFTNYFVQNISDGILTIQANVPEEINYDNIYAYHVTSKWNYDKIQKYGLIPKTKSSITTYDKRIYLWIGNINIKHMQSYGRMMLRLYDMYNIGDNVKHELYNKIDINDSVVLRINLKQFEQDHKEKLKLFGDPAHTSESAVFTIEPIKTKYIEQINWEDIK